MSRQMNFNQAARVSANPVKYCKRNAARALSYFHEAKKTAITEQFKFECDIAAKRIVHRIVESKNEHLCYRSQPCTMCKGTL